MVKGADSVVLLCDTCADTSASPNSSTTAARASARNIFEFPPSAAPRTGGGQVHSDCHRQSNLSQSRVVARDTKESAATTGFVPPF
jgi:hypothetical protein